MKKDKTQIKIRTSGGIEIVVKVINAHIGNAGVCEKGCGALWSMTHDCKALDKIK